ncbi:probable F-box protein At1g14315 isoform X2 [Salvia hispanica]|uniref:probable F-box protein At1g14315 isoform X2 n=1 Tax=Salvia hispanica TaxID=49212 RepID=UPI00200981BE|nr:probable F-box protein At1g14315 isoform X2 [Salvia hispanica]
MERDPYKTCKKCDLQQIWIPQEIWRNLLTRLPIRCLMRCRCVCKSWRNLIEGDQFATPKQFMAFVNQDMTGYAVADEDGQPLFQFYWPPYSTSHHRLVISSVNGLLLLWDGLDDNRDILFIANPMTCEYTELPPLPTRGESASSWRRILAPLTTRLPTTKPLWDSVTLRPSLDYAVFLNGNIHWVACDLENNFLVCCFDLETELFTSFPLPSLDVRILIHPEDKRSVFLYLGYRLCILEDQLCLCDTSYPRNAAKIWKMHNYGDASSWIKEYDFKSPTYYTTPLKVLTNGELLFTGHGGLFIYSKNTEAYDVRGFLQQYCYYYFPSTTIYIPSFLSLKTLGIHNVQSLCFY